MESKLELYKEYKGTGTGTLFYKEQKIADISKLTFSYHKHYAGECDTEISNPPNSDTLKDFNGEIKVGEMLPDFVAMRRSLYQPKTKFTETLDHNQLRLDIVFTHNNKTESITLTMPDFPNLTHKMCSENLNDVKFSSSTTENE